MGISDLDEGLIAGAEALGAVPIDGYDLLRATEILPLLTTLDEEGLGAVARRERQGKNRAMVLNRIARLRDRLRMPDGTLDEHPDQIIDLRDPVIDLRDPAGAAGRADPEPPGIGSGSEGEPGEWFDDPRSEELLGILKSDTSRNAPANGYSSSASPPLRRSAGSARTRRAGVVLMIATGVVVLGLLIAAVGAFALGHSKSDPSADYLAAVRKAQSGTLVKSATNAYLLALGQAVCAKVGSAEAPAQVAANMLVLPADAVMIMASATRYLCPRDAASVAAWTKGSVTAAPKPAAATTPAAAKPATAKTPPAAAAAPPNAVRLPPPVIANGIQYTMTSVSNSTGGFVITVDVKNVSAPGVALGTAGTVQMACGAGQAFLDFTGGGPGALSDASCADASIAVGTETAVPMTFPAFRIEQLPLGSTLYMTVSVGTGTVGVHFPVPTALTALPPNSTTAVVENNAQPQQGQMSDAITYVVTSTAQSVEIGYTPDGESHQTCAAMISPYCPALSVQPFIASMTVIPVSDVVAAGTSMWVSARSLDDIGDVTCQIYANGTLEDSNTGTGPGALAACTWKVDS
jgi:hypothetical protein